MHGPCCIKTGLLTLACVKLTRLLSYYLSNIAMPFCLSSVPAKFIALSNFCVPHSRLFSFYFLFIFCVILHDVLLYDYRVEEMNKKNVLLLAVDLNRTASTPL